MPTPTHTPTPTPTFAEQCGEPNDTFEQACGPLAPNRIYQGDFPGEEDEWDVYYIRLKATGSVEVRLSHIPSGNDYNLYLYDEERNLKGYSGELGNRDEHILLDPLLAGKYYLAVNRVQGTSETQSYWLRAWF